MPTFCVPLARCAKLINWRFAHARSVPADLARCSSLRCCCKMLDLALQAVGCTRIIGCCLRSRGGIGRRVWLRTVWGNPWRFEFSREQYALPAFSQRANTTLQCQIGRLVSSTQLSFWLPNALSLARTAFFARQE